MNKKPAARQPTITTTHAAWGAGHPRLMVTGESERYVHEISCDLTHIGSGPDSDLQLPSADELHATILHDTADEYVLTMVGDGATGFGPNETLRTGAHFTAGPWQLIFIRDEFADHGRPYGGRRGGELAYQRPQEPRPDYAQEHPASSLTRCALKHPARTSDRGQVDKLGHSLLMDESADPAGGRRPDLVLVNDEMAGVYEATVGDAAVGGVTYNLAGDDRIIVLGVSVFPEYRGKGISAELIRGVLDDVRAQGKTITNYCPVVSTFIEHNAGYGDLIDPVHPGRGRSSARKN
ncbi:Predicted acetyltransferase, GNAT superfamily [Nocardioides terrae]|uniref:Predicted acetyltransferase, GNAT superfamily n=1 Tax=Nocardioides terrae TaxID=574651 RepID=A0A1I1NTD5_9ACTN|nr:GNAT family N-acetyltransferase [Nocardioides terrae]SFD00685.1 Predicted acetyltransferase, GNAT superfamily [Nocardioides terrae]